MQMHLSHRRYAVRIQTARSRVSVGSPRCKIRRRHLARAVPTETQGKKKSAVVSETTSFAPATVANFGPGFDWLGCAVEGDGDVVVAEAMEEKGVRIVSIEGEGGRLPLDASKNCVGIAASAVLKKIGAKHGVSLKLRKGLPLGSGLGSSAASSAAGAHAVNCLFGNPLSKEDLILSGLVAEGAVSGYHADNIAPAILGGFVMIRSMDPVKVERLHCPTALCFALVTPEFEAPTAQMRAVLPKQIPMKDLIHNCCMAGLMLSGIHEGDPEKIGAALNAEAVIEPVRGPLIPGFDAVKQAALSAGAFGCTISGAGPTILAVVENETSGEAVTEAMSLAFKERGRLQIQKSQIVHIDMEGTRSVK